MQSVVVYGRLVARAFVTGFNSELKGPNSHQKPPKDLHLVTASSGFSKTYHPAQVIKKWSYGDDACFVAKHRLADVIGVADGVGGWREYGIDPSLLSNTLMKTCERLVKEGRFSPQAPTDILASSYQELQQHKTHLIGSTTACLVLLHRQEKTIHTANLGDSGFLVVRRGQVVHRSEEQQHYFNTPFQLALAPPLQQGLVLSDSPDSAESTQFPVQEGDIILVATDGLFDNLGDDQILDQLKLVKGSQPDSVQRAANAIAHLAHELSFDSHYMSPFAHSAKDNGINIKGGKPDDITIILATVNLGDPFNDSIT